MADNMLENIDNYAVGPLSFDRSRLADNFGARISFWDALSVEFEAFLCFNRTLGCWTTIWKYRWNMAVNYQAIIIFHLNVPKLKTKNEIPGLQNRYPNDS